MRRITTAPFPTRSRRSDFQALVPLCTHSLFSRPLCTQSLFLSSLYLFISQQLMTERAASFVVLPPLLHSLVFPLFAFSPTPLAQHRGSLVLFSPSFCLRAIHPFFPRRQRHCARRRVSRDAMSPRAVESLADLHLQKLILSFSFTSWYTPFSRFPLASLRSTFPHPCSS